MQHNQPYNHRDSSQSIQQTHNVGMFDMQERCSDTYWFGLGEGLLDWPQYFVVITAISSFCNLVACLAASIPSL